MQCSEPPCDYFTNVGLLVTLPDPNMAWDYKYLSFIEGRNSISKLIVLEEISRGGTHQFFFFFFLSYFCG